MKRAVPIILAVAAVALVAWLIFVPKKGGMEGAWVSEPPDDYSDFVKLQLDGSWSSTHVHLRSEEKKDWNVVFLKGKWYRRRDSNPHAIADSGF